MITAYNARELTKLGESSINNILSKLEEEIVKQADKGEYHYKCYQHVEWQSHRVGWSFTAVTPQQEKIINRLKELGYSAEMKWDGDQYVPPGLSDCNGDGPIHQNYVLVISW